MKYFIVFAFCATAISAKVITDTAMIDKIAEDCLVEKKLDRTWLADPSKTEAIVESCFMDCFLKKIGMIKPDGTYDVEEMLEDARTPEIKQEAKKNINFILDKCKTQAGSDKCKFAHCIGTMVGN